MSDGAPVRIVVDARYLGRPGMGITTYLEAVLQLLLDEGAVITLLVDHTTELPERYREHQVVVLRNRSRRAWEQVSAARYLRSAGDWDAYFAPGNLGLPLWCRKGGRRFVVTVHDLIPLRRARQFARRPVSYLGYLLGIAVSLARADSILVNSSYGATEVRRCSGRATVVTGQPLRVMLHDSVSDSDSDTDGSGGEEAGTADAAGAPPLRAHPYFVYNGGADPRKNVDALVLGFGDFRRRHADYELVILGNGFDRLKALVRERGDEGVVFAGYVEEPEKRRLIRNADALVYPSSLEGFGLPVVEGFREGTLVLCTDNSGLYDTAGDGALLLSSTTPGAIASGLERVADLDEKERRAWRARGDAQLDRLEASFRPELLVEAFAGQRPRVEARRR